jgi:hypothetical protein
VGAWGSYSLNGTFDRNEYFYDSTNSIVTGNTPRVAASRSERPLFPGSPVYFGVSSEYAGLVRERRSGDVSVDTGLQRVDVSPRLRYPLKRWAFFTVNTALSWRETYYSRSLSADTGAIVDAGVNRQYVTMQAQAVGPVFTRVFDTPGNGYAERFKHTIEPFVNVTRTSAIDNFDAIIQTDGIDTILGGATNLGYGINNRFYAKRPMGTTSQAQEILFVELSQTYYSDKRAAQYDAQYSTSFGRTTPSKFSPILLSARATPAEDFSATVRAEFDSQYRQLRTFAANASFRVTDAVQANGGWSRTFLIEKLPGFDNPDFLDHYLNGSATVRPDGSRFGGAYSFNYDVLRASLLQQRYSAFYNAQCCGLAFEYQSFNFAGLGGLGIPADRRFFLSFTLAGLGNFSPMNGAMGNVPR